MANEYDEAVRVAQEVVGSDLIEEDDYLRRLGRAVLAMAKRLERPTAGGDLASAINKLDDLMSWLDPTVRAYQAQPALETIRSGLASLARRLAELEAERRDVCLHGRVQHVSNVITGEFGGWFCLDCGQCVVQIWSTEHVGAAGKEAGK